MIREGNDTRTDPEGQGGMDLTVGVGVTVSRLNTKVISEHPDHARLFLLTIHVLNQPVLDQIGPRIRGHADGQLLLIPAGQGLPEGGIVVPLADLRVHSPAVVVPGDSLRRLAVPGEHGANLPGLSCAVQEIPGLVGPSPALPIVKNQGPPFLLQTLVITQQVGVHGTGDSHELPTRLLATRNPANISALNPKHLVLHVCDVQGPRRPASVCEDLQLSRVQITHHADFRLNLFRPPDISQVLGQLTGVGMQPTPQPIHKHLRGGGNSVRLDLIETFQPPFIHKIQHNSRRRPDGNVAH
mmetsp:Transcript_40462/g.88142  ORF Transcript_40462/g.88142 Transcript_40462/m.88142 type:complete len:298 (-) Transcript_40462:14-907(-)